jgi:hypothetical protein
MRARSPANSADSSPPVPARISRKALRSSSGSRGSSAACSSPCRRSRSAWHRSISRARPSRPSRGRQHVARGGEVGLALLVAAPALTIRGLGLLARQRRQRWMSADTCGSASVASSSARRSSRRSNCWRRVGFMQATVEAGRRAAGRGVAGEGANGRCVAGRGLARAAAQEQARHGLRASCSRSAPSAGVQLGQRAVQHLVRQPTGQRLEHGSMARPWPAACARAASRWRASRRPGGSAPGSAAPRRAGPASGRSSARRHR